MNFKKYLYAFFIGALLITATFTFGQSKTFFTGTITDIDTEVPVAGYPVFIFSADSSFFHVTITNEEGVYIDSLNTDPVLVGIVSVYVYDCNETLISMVFQQPDTLNIADFEICTNQPDCLAYFEYEAYTGTEVFFYNFSSGNFTSYAWDFGDYTYSDEFNPVHTYNAPGVYQVCLTISDSSMSCFDSYCQIIYVYDSSCHADFFWEVNDTYPLMLEFTDASEGDIAEWYWDFGDETISWEQNPVHEYALPGWYTVSLSIFGSDSAANCFDTYVELIWVGDSSGCEANFSYALDSLNQTINTYLFQNLSEGNSVEWYWDFGDGYYSEEQNPVHSYDSAGTYLVCLTVYSYNAGSSCQDTYCMEIATPEYFNFGGQVFLGDYPLNIEEDDSSNMAVAHLYLKYNDQWQWVDSKDFWKYGYYWFTNKLGGDYLILTELTPNSADYQSYAPAYYGNSIYWNYAETFVLDDNESFAVNLNLRELSPVQQGAGLVGGILREGADCGNEVAVEGGLLFLFNEMDELIAFTYSAAGGYFTFENLAMGIYTVKVEVPGKYGSQITVGLTDENPYWGDLSLYYQCNSFLGDNELPDQKAQLIGKIFPQPASDLVNIELHVEDQTDLLIELMDMSGQTIYGEVKQHVSPSGAHLTVDTKSFSSGLYILRVVDTAKGGADFKKILISH